MSVDTSGPALARLQHDLKHSLSNDVFSEARRVIHALQAERDAAHAKADTAMRVAMNRRRESHQMREDIIRLLSDHERFGDTRDCVAAIQEMEEKP
jgi:hypothetical protein